MTVALLIIDMQLDFFDHEGLKAQRSRLAANVNELVRSARHYRWPIVWVQQIYATDLSDASLEVRRGTHRIVIEGTPGAQLLPELDVASEDTFLVKKRYSAFFGTNLDLELKKLACSEIVMAGINTHACIRTTVIDAYQRDLDVVIAGDCVGSHDQSHHESTMLYLNGKMSRVLSNARIESSKLHVY